MHKTIALLLGLSVTLPAIRVAAAETADVVRAKRPNIIFLLTDDQRDNTFGAMGHAWVETPHIDKLIRDGVRFANAYIAEPTCSPSRVALLTGMHERVNGVGFSSSYKLNEEQWAKTYPALLRESGYYTGFIGKFGVEYYTFRGRAEEKFDFWRGHDGWAKFFVKNAPNCRIYWDSDEKIITPVMGESMDRFLNAAPVDKPFCLSVSFSIPHGSQVVSMAPVAQPANKVLRLRDHPIYGSLYRDLKISIPEDVGTDPYRFIPKTIMNQARGRSRIYAYDYNRRNCHEHHLRYYQQITGMDQEIGRMLDTLKRKGLADNTIIIFASDHGVLMGEYGMGGKGLLYDLASKIPCFVYDPRLPAEQRGRTVTELVSSLDITSTILDYAGIPQPKEMEGSSLLPLIHGESTRWRKAIFLENLYTGRDTPFSEGIRKGKWKYIRMYDGVAPYAEKHVDFHKRQPAFEQLFDLNADSGEKQNLIDEDVAKPILDELRQTCASESQALNDRREQFKTNHTVTSKR